jgi:hypothetical protein
MSSASILFIIPPVLPRSITAVAMILTTTNLAPGIWLTISPVKVAVALAVGWASRSPISPDEGQVLDGCHVGEHPEDQPMLDVGRGILVHCSMRKRNIHRGRLHIRISDSQPYLCRDLAWI